MLYFLWCTVSPEKDMFGQGNIGLPHAVSVCSGLSAGTLHCKPTGCLGLKETFCLVNKLFSRQLEAHIGLRKVMFIMDCLGEAIIENGKYSNFFLWGS